MNEKFQPADDTFDDVTGHAARGKAAQEEEPTEDTEGHGVRIRFSQQQEPTEDSE